MTQVPVPRSLPALHESDTLLGMLDIGSNAMKLALCRITPGGPCAPHTLEERITWLNQGLDEDGVIADHTVRRLITHAGELLAVAEKHGATVLGAVATAAMRKADNRIEVMNRLRKAHGIQTRLLSPFEEAAAGYMAVYESLRGVDAADGNRPLVTFDLGGRSAEMTVGNGPAPSSSISVELGASQLKRDAPTSDPPVPSEIERIRALAKDRFRDLERPPRDADVVMLGATATTLAGYIPVLFAREFGMDAVTHLDRDMIRGLVEELAKMTVAQRKLLPGNPERAEIILHGAIALEQAYKYLGFRNARISPDGVAIGSLISEVRGMPLDYVPIEVNLPAADFRPLTKSDREGEVVFALRRNDGHIYLQHKIDYPVGTYRLPGGGVDLGEDTQAAFARELYEETGAEQVRSHPLATLRYRGPDGERLDFYTRLYLVELEDHVPRPLDGDEGIEDYAPVAPDDLATWVTRLEGLRGDMHPWGVFRAAALRALVERIDRLPV